MEIKILCHCGQKFAFDIEPVNNRMPHAVGCPACGADGTVAANAIIARQLPAEAPIIIPPANTSAAPGGLRLSASVHEAPATPPPASNPGLPPRQMHMPAPAPLAQDPDEFNLGLGILGAFLGAVFGSGILFACSLLLGFKFPLFGTIVGALTGWCAKKFYKGTSNGLGAIAAGIALVFGGATLFLMYGGFSLGAIFSMLFCVGFAWKIAGGE